MAEDKKELNIEEIKKPAPEERGSLNKIERQLEESEKKSAEYLAGWQRARADFLNYKKEEMERIGEILKYAGEEFILKILPILDNIYIAENKIPEDFKKNQWVEGLLKIKNQLEDYLKNQGVEEIKAVGKKFDPNLHEAVEQVEAKDKESGTIIEEVQKGYKINGRLLRPAKVRVVK